MTQQGVLLRGEFRQRLMDGAYTIRASGIWQLDPAPMCATAHQHSGQSEFPRQH